MLRLRRLCVPHQVGATFSKKAGMSSDWYCAIDRFMQVGRLLGSLPSTMELFSAYAREQDAGHYTQQPSWP